ncbi:MAG: hypothetical protein AAFW69_10815 [Pseudomonadota bacterium]
MRPLIYFSYGVTKTGSTLAFHYVHALMERAGWDQSRLSEAALGNAKMINYFDDLDDEMARHLVAEVEERGTPVVLKTHQRPSATVARLIDEGRAVGHACYRDPREVVLSMLDHGEKSRRIGAEVFSEIETMDDALASLRHQIDRLTDWLRLPQIIPLCYDDVAFAGAATVGRLAAQLGIEDVPEAVEREVKETRFTQFNKGAPARWRREMCVEDAERIATEFRPMIRQLIRRRARLADAKTPVLGPAGQLRRIPRNAEATAEAA